MSETEQPRGLVCRKCECRHFYVVWTRPLRNGTILRKRECRHCGARVVTSERPMTAG